MADTDRRRKRPTTLQTVFEHATDAVLNANAVVALRSPSWWRSLPRKLARVLLVVLLALTGVTWHLGGITATATYLVPKETRINFPASETLRLLAARVLANRDLPPETLVSLTRMAHVLAPDDPLRPHVVAALARATGGTDDPALAAGQFLKRVDEAVARKTNRTLAGHGVIDWRLPDSYFFTTLDELAGVSGVAKAVEVFNGLQPPDGFPTSEWYLDELVNGFDDPRPVPFVLVTSSSGDDWTPLAMPPDAVPAYARRLPARTVGEALRIGLWGYDAYHPGDPTVDPVRWWARVASEQALPAFEP